jgi:cell division protein FtsQ
VKLQKLRYDRLTWVLFLFIVVMIWLLARAKKKQDFISDMSVLVNPLDNGEKLIREGDVKQALLLAFGSGLEGTELIDLEVERMEKTLEEDPFILDAETYVDQNNMLHIEVDQREPVLRILDNHGGNYYIDGEGRKMPPSKHFTARVLVATGNVSNYVEQFQKKKRSTLKDLFTLTQTILADDFWRAFVQQIHVSNANEFILIPLVGDQKIILGSVRRLDDKLKRLRIFYQNAMPYEGWKKYSTINLKYNGQIVCRK